MADTLYDRSAPEPADGRIPLDESEPSASALRPVPACDGSATAVRGRRTSPRKSHEGCHVLFAPEARPGQIDQAECPLVDISAGGMAIKYDRPLKPGVKGAVSYRSVCDLPVHVTFVVRRCVPQESGLYLIGLQLDRKLRIEDRRPVRCRPGREVVAGVRARRIGRGGVSLAVPALPDPDRRPRIEPSPVADDEGPLELEPLPEERPG